MADKQVLILLHGMGNHTSESFKNEVVTAANNALGRYPSYEYIDFAEKVDIHSIAYDHIFEELREKMADSGSSLQEFISTELGGVNLPRFFDDLVEIEAGLGSEEFIYTHVLDVVFYLTLLGEKVRLHVAEEILKIKQQYPTTARINVLAHSLGTAVTHDTLNKLFTTGPTSGTQLNVDEHKLTSLWTMANVSQIISTFSGLTGPLDSVVKPGKGGCLVRFNNAYHRFDPFTLKPFKRFDPDNSSQWLEPVVFQYRYKRFKTEKVSRLNTHSVQGYLEDPVVCHDFLNHFFDFKPAAEEKAKGDAAFKHEQDLREDIIDFVTEIDSVADVTTFIKMMKEYLHFLKVLDD
jgi:hypothetical protein